MDERFNTIIRHLFGEAVYYAKETYRDGGDFSEYILGQAKGSLESDEYAILESILKGTI